MTRLSLVMAVAVLGLTALPASYAEHARVQVDVAIVRDGTVVASYTDYDTSCSGTFCHVDFDFVPDSPDDRPGRDYARFERWCPTTTVTITLPAGSSSAPGGCDGPGQWTVQIGVYLQNLQINPALHPDNVVVEVHAHPP